MQHLKKAFLPLASAAVGAMMSLHAVADYTTHPLAKEFVDDVVKEYGLDRESVENVLKNAEKKQNILDAMSRPAEKTKEWFEYRKIFLGQDRIDQGIEFWKQNADAIQKASKKYGVAPEIIVAIIGVETRYGRYTGSYRVIDALATLGFDYPQRGAFFRKELGQFLILAKEQKQDPTALTGSYAGAMGYGQFIPSSYRHFAVDFDQDGVADIWKNPVDAIGSVANYFSEHHWQMGKPTFVKAKIVGKPDESVLDSKAKPSLTLKEAKAKGYVPAEGNYPDSAKVVPLSYVGDNGKEYWLGFDNFYVITRYNRSHMYALAVWQLSQEIRQGYFAK